jgi:hypothetical protein
MGGLDPPIQGNIACVYQLALDGRVEPGHGEMIGYVLAGLNVIATPFMQ